MSALLDGRLHRELLAARDPDLLLHQIDSSEHFSNRMLDLDAGVHLHEVERLVLVEEHLDRSGADVVDRLGSAHRGLTHFFAQRIGERGARRFFDQLLVPALHRAVALAQVHDVAVAVAHDLELDVPRALEVLLHVHLAVSESGERFGARELQRSAEVLGIARDAHALPAPARRRLDDDRKSDLARELERFVRIVDRSRRAGDDGDTDILHRFPRGRLVAHHPDLRRRRADERDVRRHADLGELGVLRQESVTRMDGVSPGDLGGGDDAGDVEVRFARRRGPDADVVIGEAHVQRFAIGFGVHRDGLHAELAAGADHP